MTSLVKERTWTNICNHKEGLHKMKLKNFYFTLYKIII